MRTYANNADLLAQLRSLIDSWCQRQCLKALMHVLPGFFAFNGLTDGWGELREALSRVRAFARNELTSAELETISDLIAAADRALQRRP